ncbi:GSCFA domain-containing protein [Caulobacter sp. S45]|uniref:GSCFA domain-containing protein n=1 Tax=Caulobacter sp. S45 TaxID=1641861 RepID=UPI001575BF04|nr:GSCFA domain-containing protein [Caulobacter sp. S45]
MEKGESVFTIGSCFARNVETRLEAAGFYVPMRQLEIVSEYVGSNEDNPNIFNNYGAPSILNELQWALGERDFDPETCLLEVTPGKFCDLHLTRLLKAVPVDEALARRNRIKAAMAKVRDCRIIIITLGLVEVWYDNHSQSYLNIPPPKMAAAKYPDRFVIHVMQYNDILDCLNETLALIGRHNANDFKVVLTVSPVPLALTFTDQDVIVANTYSKSVLRAVSQELADRHANVDYFPSYESIVLSDRKEAWQDDQRHPTQSIISENVNRMVAAYMGGDDLDALTGDASALYKQGRFVEAAAEYEKILAQAPGRADARLGLAKALLGQRQGREAVRLTKPIVTRNPEDADATIVLAHAYRLMGKTEAHQELYSRLVGFGSAASLREAVLDSFEAGDMDRVEEACAMFQAKAPRHPFPLEYRARVKIAQGDLHAAEVLILEALGFNQAIAGLYALLGDVQRKLGKREDAGDAFTRALAINPKTSLAIRGLRDLGMTSSHAN